MRNARGGLLVVDSRRELPTTSTCESSERVKIVGRRSFPDRSHRLGRGLINLRGNGER